MFPLKFTAAQRRKMMKAWANLVGLINRLWDSLPHGIASTCEARLGAYSSRVAHTPNNLYIDVDTDGLYLCLFLFLSLSLSKCTSCDWKTRMELCVMYYIYMSPITTHSSVCPESPCCNAVGVVCMLASCVDGTLRRSRQMKSEMKALLLASATNPHENRRDLRPDVVIRTHNVVLLKINLFSRASILFHWVSAKTSSLKASVFFLSFIFLYYWGTCIFFWCCCSGGI